MNKKYTILIIDDKVENLQYLSSILEVSYEIRPSLDGKQALNALKFLTPDLILLDIKMPNIDGFEICKLIKQEPNLKEIPIIFISAFDDIHHKIEAFDNGGVDYITKPFEPKEVLARVKSQLEIAQSKKTIINLLEVQDIFVKKIMHEMNTPMSIISLNTEAIERKVGPMNEFNSIRASVKTLSSIYGDLSYMIKKETRVYEKKEIKILDFITSRIMFFDEIATVKSINIDLELTHEFNIKMNDYELERIIDNTLSNAIKYSNEDSHIDIFIGIEKNRYLIKIQDYGTGMEEDVDVFLPYYQQSNENSGLGLGLTIVKEICNKYDINIEVQSERSKGTQFIYDFTSVVDKGNE
ncbi:hybrid sensor histidine kinase/response regulator [Arcobacter sp. 31_11_sub10_T18]|nr:hybrid sensor histidine kinase/response regulator [Arcobacter sp. 31_11_sub10_T18]